MIHQMTQRERVLATLVGTVAFLFITFIVFDYFMKNQRRLQGELARNTVAVAAMKLQLAEKSLWEVRNAELSAKLPVLAAEDRALAELLDQVTQIAKSKSVQIGTQNLGVVTRQPEYTSASVQLDNTTSTWEALKSFLYAVQSPGNFLVFESANLKRDDKDETQMRCTFKIAKWFAPKPKLK